MRNICPAQGDRRVRPSARSAAAIAFVLLAALLVEGCLTNERAAPPVTPELIEIGRQQGFRSEAPERGRRIYLTRCGICHNIEPIESYSKDRWLGVLVEMSKEARLDGGEAEALRAYVLSVCEAARTPP